MNGKDMTSPSGDRRVTGQESVINPSTSSPAFVFDQEAELYARVRPSYPAALIDDLIALAALRIGSRVLEIGCGPGNASVLLAGRGYRMVCLEPGPRLSDIARKQLEGDPGSSVVTTTFEAYPIQPASLDLIFAAQSFHWIEPEIRFAKSAQALAPGGTLAVFANRAVPGWSPVEVAIRNAYAAHAPEIAERPEQSNTAKNFVATFDASGLFRPAAAREYPWKAEYAAEGYVDLLRTYSDHRLLPAEQRARLHQAIRSAIDRHGGRLAVDYVAVLTWATRA
jgi:SAM-dependent methyltransferase